VGEVVLSQLGDKLVTFPGQFHWRKLALMAGSSSPRMRLHNP
jgi:hypothetical protein